VFTEQRKSARKILKTKAVLVLDSAGPVSGRTADLSANGVSVGFADPLAPGQVGQLMFDLFVDGKLTTIKARAKAMYCIFSGGEFKVGFEFVNLDLAAMTAVARFLR
jgi:c-di-GMP-binding flagellar brake protein YcgR